MPTATPAHAAPPPTCTGDDRLTVHWDDTDGALTYELFRDSSAGGAFAAKSLGGYLLSFETLVLSAYALAVRAGALTPREAGLRLLADAVPAAWMLLAALYWTHRLSAGAPFKPGGCLAGLAVGLHHRILPPPGLFR